VELAVGDAESETPWARHYEPGDKQMRKTLLKLLLLALVALPSGRAWADGYGGSLAVTNLNAGSSGYTFGTSSQSSGTCSYFGYYFYIPYNAPGASQMYATLLAAKLSGRTINVWYNLSTAPGTNETSGCTIGAMAAAYGVGIN
jgi:hypothetical protein